MTAPAINLVLSLPQPPQPQPLLPLQQQRRIRIQIQLLPPPQPFPLLFVNPLQPQSLQHPVAAKSLMILASTSMFDISYGAKIVPVPKEYIKCLK